MFDTPCASRLTRYTHTQSITRAVCGRDRSVDGGGAPSIIATVVMAVAAFGWAGQAQGCASAAVLMTAVAMRGGAEVVAMAEEVSERSVGKGGG